MTFPGIPRLWESSVSLKAPTYLFLHYFQMSRVSVLSEVVNSWWKTKMPGMTWRKWKCGEAAGLTSFGAAPSPPTPTPCDDDECICANNFPPLRQRARDLTLHFCSRCAWKTPHSPSDSRHTLMEIYFGPAVIGSSEPDPEALRLGPRSERSAPQKDNLEKRL